MRCCCLILSLLLLTHCSGISDYSADRGSSTSLTGNQGGSGAQATLWSSDPGHKTVLNQNGAASP